LLIAGSSTDAINRGEYEVVLGEIHVAANTLDAAFFMAQHPEPESLHSAFARDVPEPLVYVVFAKENPKVTVRYARAFVPPNARLLETGFDRADADRDRVIALADLVVERRGDELVVRSTTDTTLEPIPIIELFGDALSLLASGALRVGPRLPHVPRITVDRLVVARESWMVDVSTTPFGKKKNETDEERFLAARRWARAHGMPRYVFAKATTEVKPIFVDFDSPVFVNVLSRVVRSVSNHVSGPTPIMFTEMLPGPEHLWLEDRAGEKYTAELRVVALDRARQGEA
jgi:hypothetical protein